MIVYHVALTTTDDYVARREPHRRAHIERLQKLRAAGMVVAGGPAPDGTSVEIVYRVQEPTQLDLVIHEDPYWQARAWTGYTPRSFTEFVEPWEVPPIVLGGSRRVTVVEGPATDRAMAELALIEMRGARRIVLGGLFADGTTLALAGTDDANTARGWFGESGLWRPERLITRPLLYVL